MCHLGEIDPWSKYRARRLFGRSGSGNKTRIDGEPPSDRNLPSGTLVRLDTHHIWYIYTVYWIYMSYFQHITQPSLIIHLVEVIHLEDHVRPEVWRNSPPVICDDLMYFYMMVWDDPTIS